MDFGDIFSGGIISSISSMVPQLLGGYANMRNQNERLDREEKNAWDMYQTQRADANTAHQRETADLKAAGLNPILGLKGSGSPVASGSATTGNAGQMAMPDIMSFMATLKGLDQKDREIGLQNKRLALDTLNAATEREYKGVQIKNEKYGVQGLISDLYKGLLNEKHQHTNLNDIISLMRKMSGYTSGGNMQ